MRSCGFILPPQHSILYGPLEPFSADLKSAL